MLLIIRYKCYSFYIRHFATSLYINVTIFLVSDPFADKLTNYMKSTPISRKINIGVD
nr:MAG TPA: hypothetical protein [Caudoviricetes sp.]